MAWHSLTHCEHFECKQVGGNQLCCKFSGLNNFPGTVGAQVASSNRVLTSMGWGVQRGGWGQASQVSAPHGSPQHPGDSVLSTRGSMVS